MTSLPGLMVAMGVSSGVLLTALSLFQFARADFQHHHQITLLEESAALGLEIIARTVRQATAIDEQSPKTTSTSSSGGFPFRGYQGAVQGLDNARINSQGGTTTSDVNGSDLLAVQLRSALADVINCAGFVVSDTATTVDEFGWVMFYLATGPGGEPDLYCRYYGQKKWESQAILSGVEFFQVLYGLDRDDDGLPNQYLSASEIALQESQQATDHPSIWRRVVAVHVALVLRSSAAGIESLRFSEWDLFGTDYRHIFGSTDIGTTIRSQSLSPSLRTRVRRRIDRIIFLTPRASAS